MPKAFSDMAQVMNQTVETLLEAGVIDKLIEAGVVDKPLPTDPKVRALELRKRRSTGPAVGRYRLDGSRY